MQFMIEHTNPCSDETLHTAVVTGLSEVIHAASGLAEGDPIAARWLERVGRESEGELRGAFGVFRFAPAA